MPPEVCSQDEREVIKLVGQASAGDAATRLTCCTYPLREKALTWVLIRKEINMGRNHFIKCALASMVIAASASACMQEELPGDETGVEQEALTSSEQSDELAALGQDPEMGLTEAESGELGLSMLAEDGTEGQLEELTYDTDADLEHNGGCSYVQWCNEPGYWGTVCIKHACSWAAALAECKHEAQVHICGRINYPLHLVQ